MMILIAAAVAAVQPASAATTTPPAHAHAHAQHQEMGHMKMSEKEMADCHKCCEEMMAKMHKGHAAHSGNKS